MTNRNDTTSIVRFGDVARTVRNVVDPETSGLERYIAGEHMDTDDLRLRRWGTIGDGYLGPAFHMKFEAGQILYGSRRTYLRKVALADFDGVCANTTFVIEAIPERILPELLPFIMQTESFTQHSILRSRGSTNPYVTWSDIARYEFPLPPLNEQRRIAEILWAVEEAVNEYQSTQSHLESYRDVFIARSMHGNNDYDVLQDSKIGLIPASWELVELQDVADVIYGLTVNPTSRNLPIKSPYLRVANVMRGYLSLEEVKEIGVTEDDVKYVLKSGDVLVVEGHADVFEIGRAAIWEEQISNCLHQNHILRARCTGAVSPYFLLAYINSPRGRSYFRRMTQSTSGLNTINST